MVCFCLCYLIQSLNFIVSSFIINSISSLLKQSCVPLCLLNSAWLLFWLFYPPILVSATSILHNELSIGSSPVLSVPFLDYALQSFDDILENYSESSSHLVTLKTLTHSHLQTQNFSTSSSLSKNSSQNTDIYISRPNNTISLIPSSSKLQVFQKASQWRDYSNVSYSYLCEPLPLGSGYLVFQVPSSQHSNISKTVVLQIGKSVYSKKLPSHNIFLIPPSSSTSQHHKRDLDSFSFPLSSPSSSANSLVPASSIDLKKPSRFLSRHSHAARSQFDRSKIHNSFLRTRPPFALKYHLDAFKKRVLLKRSFFKDSLFTSSFGSFEKDNMVFSQQHPQAKSHEPKLKAKTYVQAINATNATFMLYCPGGQTTVIQKSLYRFKKKQYHYNRTHFSNISSSLTHGSNQSFYYYKNIWGFSQLVHDTNYTSNAMARNPSSPAWLHSPLTGVHNTSDVDASFEALGDEQQASIPHFLQSVIPAISILASTLAIVYVMLLAILCSSRLSEWPKLQLLSLGFSTFTITLTLGLVTKTLNDQAIRGYLSGPELTHFIDDNLLISILFLISGVICRISEVQTLLVLFKRPVESKVIFWLGTLLTLTHTSLWICFLCFADSNNPALASSDDVIGWASGTDGNNNISSNYNSTLINESIGSYHLGSQLLSAAQEALAAFEYLFKISMSILYCCCICAYCIIQRKVAFCTRGLTVIGILSLISIFLPVALFILDITNSDISLVGNWMDYVDLVALLGSTVVVREWIMRAEFQERKRQNESVLGRQIYADDENGFTYNHNPSRFLDKQEYCCCRAPHISKISSNESTDTNTTIDFSSHSTSSSRATASSNKTILNSNSSSHNQNIPVANIYYYSRQTGVNLLKYDELINYQRENYMKPSNLPILNNTVLSDIRGQLKSINHDDTTKTHQNQDNKGVMTETGKSGNKHNKYNDLEGQRSQRCHVCGCLLSIPYSPKSQHARKNIFGPKRLWNWLMMKPNEDEAYNPYGDYDNDDDDSLVNHANSNNNLQHIEESNNLNSTTAIFSEAPYLNHANDNEEMLNDLERQSDQNDTKRGQVLLTKPESRHMDTQVYTKVIKPIFESVGDFKRFLGEMIFPRPGTAVSEETTYQPAGGNLMEINDTVLYNCNHQVDQDSKVFNKQNKKTKHKYPKSLKCEFMQNPNTDLLNTELTSTRDQFTCSVSNSPFAPTIIIPSSTVNMKNMTQFLETCNQNSSIENNGSGQQSVSATKMDNKDLMERVHNSIYSTLQYSVGVSDGSSNNSGLDGKNIDNLKCDIDDNIHHRTHNNNIETNRIGFSDAQNTKRKSTSNNFQFLQSKQNSFFSFFPTKVSSVAFDFNMAPDGPDIQNSSQTPQHSPFFTKMTQFNHSRKHGAFRNNA